MSNLFFYSNLVYELSMYLFVIMGYLERERFLLPLFIVMISSLLISGAPSTLYKLKFKVDRKITNIDGILKLSQLFIIFVLVPTFGIEKAIISFVFLIGISIIGIPIKKRIFEQLSNENVKLYEINERIDVYDKVNKEFDNLTSLAWRTLFPFFFLGILNNSIKLLILVLITIIVLETMIILKLYKEMVKLNYLVAKDFLIVVIKSIILFVVLIFTLFLDKSGFLKFFIVGAFTNLYVNFIRNQFEKNDKTYENRL